MDPKALDGLIAALKSHGEEIAALHRELDSIRDMLIVLLDRTKPLDTSIEKV